MNDKKNIGIFILIADGIFAQATFMPWAVATDGFSYLNRNIYQMGANLSFDYNGFFALVWIALLAANGLNLMGAVKIHRVFLRASWYLPFGLTLSVLRPFFMQFPQVPGVIWSRGAGSWLAVVSVLMLFVAAEKDEQSAVQGGPGKHR
jgi:hypothetical protein